LARTLTTLAAVVLATGCMTIDTRSDRNYDGPRIYSGTRVAARQTGEAILEYQLGWLVLFGLDVPLSFVADTLLLPVTIGEERRRRSEQAERLQVGDERPPPVEIAAGSDPIAAAKRVFEACLGRLQRYNPLMTDCFSLEARVFYVEGTPTMLTGEEYRPRVRAQLAEMQARNEFFTWRDPEFAVDGDRVRVDVQRASSERGDLGELSLWISPDARGAWRIVEVRGARWR